MPDAIEQPSSSLKRDVSVISLIGSAHFFSHFYQLSLAPLFPLLHDVFGVSYVMLGSAVTVFYAVSGVCQTFAGILVDHYGSRRILIAGIALMAISFLLIGLVPQFWMFYPLLILAGFGNSIFHPSDFSALSHYVSLERHGRAFSIHAFAGSLGYAAAPIITGSLGVVFGWRLALVIAGLLGLGMTGLLLRYSKRFMPDFHEEHKAENHPKFSYLKVITMPAIMLAFAYLVFTSSATGAIQTFSTVSFIDHYHVTLTAAATALSAYIICSALGMLTGGVIADHTKRHARVAMTGLALASWFTAIVALGHLPFAWVIAALAAAGFCQGTTTPSRDILVKNAAPPGSIGRVFGIVYSGGDAALAISPLAFGALADHHAYHMIFLGVAVLYLIGIATVMNMGQKQAAQS